MVIVIMQTVPALKRGIYVYPSTVQSICIQHRGIKLAVASIYKIKSFVPDSSAVIV